MEEELGGRLTILVWRDVFDRGYFWIFMEIHRAGPMGVNSRNGGVWEGFGFATTLLLYEEEKRYVADSRQ